MERGVSGDFTFAVSCLSPSPCRVPLSGTAATPPRSRTVPQKDGVDSGCRWRPNFHTRGTWRCPRWTCRRPLRCTAGLARLGARARLRFSAELREGECSFLFCFVFCLLGGLDTKLKGGVFVVRAGRSAFQCAVMLSAVPLGLCPVDAADECCAGVCGSRASPWASRERRPHFSAPRQPRSALCQVLRTELFL